MTANPSKMTTVNDLVLIHYENRPMTYARIEDITPDHKPGWFHVKLLLLQIPLQVVTWILRDVYIDGEEYTMGGKPMRLERIECPPDEDDQSDDPVESPALLPRPDAKVIALKDLKKKR